MKKISWLFIYIVILLMLCMPVFAEIADNPLENYQPGPVNGTWALEYVYENASGEDRILLNPENAQSLYANAANIYAFLPDGTGYIVINEGGGLDGFTVYGEWNEIDGAFTLSCNNTKGYEESGKAYEPDLDPGYEMTFNYDAETDTLHQFWKEENPDAAYHDLDFVYTRAPIGAWQMKKVFSTDPGQEPVVLDPEKAASLYSESINTYFLDASGSATLRIDDPSADPYFGINGKWNKEGDDYIMKMDDESDMKFYYDSEADVLHRYWKSNQADDTYDSLDFVYYRVPVYDALKMKVVLGVDSDGQPIILDPQNADSLYQETNYNYYFNTDGTALSSIPGVIEEHGTWTMNDYKIVLNYDDGTDMQFEYDSKAGVLHRYWKDNDPEATYPSLDFVYMYR